MEVLESEAIDGWWRDLGGGGGGVFRKSEIMARKGVADIRQEKAHKLCLLFN